MIPDRGLLPEAVIQPVHQQCAHTKQKESQAGVVLTGTPAPAQLQLETTYLAEQSHSFSVKSFFNSAVSCLQAWLNE